MLCEDCQIDYENLDEAHEEFIQVMDGIDPGLLQKTTKGPSLKDVVTFLTDLTYFATEKN